MTTDTIIAAIVQYCTKNRTKVTDLDFGNGKIFPYQATLGHSNWIRKGETDRRINTTTYNYQCIPPEQQGTLDYHLQANVVVDKTGIVHDISLERIATTK